MITHAHAPAHNHTEKSTRPTPTLSHSDRQTDIHEHDTQIDIDKLTDIHALNRAHTQNGEAFMT